MPPIFQAGRAREFFAYSAVGSTIALTDSAGAVKESNLYEAYGGIVVSTGSSANNRLANTKERDASIGLDNHGRRYYDPEIGRYINPDPLGHMNGLNKLLYVRGNPATRVDLFGLFIKIGNGDPEKEVPTPDGRKWTYVVLMQRALVVHAD